ncbi:MAG: ECF-type sigma factor [Pirellula sp.]|jgi:DNA-directed RNA polymerase specialized sigma24 family protein
MRPEETEKLQQLLRSASSGDSLAYEELWGMLYPKLKAAVHQKVVSMPRLVNDASDLTSEALQSFFRRAFVDQEFDLNCPNSVWQLLKLITMRHVNDVFKGLKAAKRGGGVAPLSLESVGKFSGSGDVGTDSSNDFMGLIPDVKQTEPSEEIEWSELLDRLLASIDDKTARKILLLRLEHHSNSEIADMLQISIRTVQRHLKVIAGLWRLESEKPS